MSEFTASRDLSSLVSQELRCRIKKREIRERSIIINQSIVISSHPAAVGP